MSLQLYRVAINLSFGAMCFLLVSSASADTSSGLDAFEKGDFQKAQALLLPLAETGDADAEYAVGLMYLKGLGLEQEVLAARFWIARSAERGNIAASDALQKIENLLEQRYSRGLPRVDGADGSSRERAIFLPDVHNESAGIRAEHLIVGFFFSGWTWKAQAVMNGPSARIYDVITLEKSGAQRDIYFDITNWFWQKD